MPFSSAGCSIGEVSRQPGPGHHLSNKPRVERKKGEGRGKEGSGGGGYIMVGHAEGKVYGGVYSILLVGAES